MENEWERMDRAEKVAKGIVLLAVIVLTVWVLGLIITSGEDGMNHSRKDEYGIIQVGEDGIREEGTIEEEVRE